MRSITPSFHKAIVAKILQIETKFGHQDMLRHNTGKKREITDELKADREKLETLYNQYQQKLGELEEVLETYHVLQHFAKMKMSKLQRLYFAVCK